MRENLKLLSKNGLMIVYAVLTLLMLVGTLFDLKINTVLYNPNNLFAIFFKYYGFFAGVIAAFVSLAIFLRILTNNYKDLISWICSIFNVYILYKSITSFYKLFADLDGMPRTIRFVICIVLAIAFAIFVFIKTDISNPTKARNVAMIILFTFAAQLILINNVIKGPWGRPRYKALLAIDEIEFVPWYHFGLSDIAKNLIANGTAADLFKSFPSGHAGGASSIIPLVLLVKIIPSLKDKENVITCGVILWTLLTMFGRIMDGAHFFTDVTFAVCITFTCFVLFSKLLGKELD